MHSRTAQQNLGHVDIQEDGGAPESAAELNSAVSRRRKVFQRSAERLEIRRCACVVAGRASQENQ